MMKTYLMTYTHNIMSKVLYMSGLKTGNKVHMSHCQYHHGRCIDITFYFIRGYREYAFQLTVKESVKGPIAKVMYGKFVRTFDGYDDVGVEYSNTLLYYSLDPKTDKFYYFTSPKYHLKAIKHEPGIVPNDLLADVTITTTTDSICE